MDMLHYNDVIMSAMASQITSLTIVYSPAYSGADQRKHQSSASLGFLQGIHRWPVNSPHKGPVTRKMFPFNGVIMDVTDRRFCTKPLPHLQQFSAKIQHTSLEKLIHSQTSQYILKPSLPLVRTKLRWVHAYNICVGGITSSSSLSRTRLL